MKKENVDTYTILAPIVCPTDHTTLEVTYSKRTHAPLLLACPKCGWKIDLDLQRRIAKHKIKMEKNAKTLVSLEAAATDMGAPIPKDL